MRSRRRKIALSAVIGTVIMFAMLLSVAGTYFYFIQQDQASFQKAVAQTNNNLLNDQSAEHLTVYGISQSQELAFYINNTGIALSIVSYWVLNGTSGAVIQYKNQTTSTSLPFIVGQGQSSVFAATSLNPQIIIPLNANYVIKVLTSRGTQGVGTYPSQQVNSATVNSLVAGGFGSLEMTFSSFEWYSYLSGPPQSDTYTVGGTPTTFNDLCATGSETETNCNGGSYTLDINHPHSGSIVPGGYNATDTYYTSHYTTTTSTGTTSTPTTSTGTTTTTSTAAAAMAIDGSNQHEVSSSTSSIATTITTTNAHDLIVVYVSAADTGSNNPPSVSSISGGGLTWTHRVTTSVETGSSFYQKLEEWYALAPSTLNSVTITATLSGSATGETWIAVFGISGASTSTPFDPNVSLPATATATNNVQTTMSTTNANDMLLYSCAPFSGSMASGFTTIESYNSYSDMDEYVGYKTVSSTQSNIVTSCGGSGTYGVEITDAVQAAPTTTSTITSTYTTTSTVSSTYTTTSTKTSTSTSTSFGFYQTPVAFSVNITNDDPSLGTIVINSASNLWVIETCDSGTAEGNCPSGNPFFVFYIMDVNPSTGAVTSTAAGSFAEIVIPYGVTKTLYYGAAYDISLQSFTPVGLTSAISTNAFYYGQFSVFLLFSGTKIISPQVLVYGQNIPFESTTAADNFGWVAQTPTTCNPGAPTTFSLNVNDSIFAYANPNNPVGVDNIVINSSAFSSVSVSSSPTGWTGTANSPSTGYITWSTGTKADYIANGTTDTFTWQGTAPSPASSTQYIFPITVTWSTGDITTVQSALECSVA
jgi:hypothetical protein